MKEPTGMNVTFEARRLYVAPRKSVLFFAVVGERRLRATSTDRSP